MNSTPTLSSKQKGEIAENRVAEMITLGSSGALSCFRPVTDDDGIDLIVSPKGAFKPLYIQIKSRFKLQKNKRFIQNVGLGTFSPHPCFYVLFLLFNEQTLDVDAIWLVPSLDLKDKAFQKEAGKTYKSFYRITANPNPNTSDRWKDYLTSKTDVVDHIYAAIHAIYPNE